MQSVEVGASLLRALADADAPQSLGALARAAGMSSAKAHRYLVSYVQAGLAVQSERNGTYDLGPLAVRLGLAALGLPNSARAAGTPNFVIILLDDSGWAEVKSGSVNLIGPRSSLAHFSQRVSAAPRPG